MDLACYLRYFGSCWWSFLVSLFFLLLLVAIGLCFARGQCDCVTRRLCGRGEGGRRRREREERRRTRELSERRSKVCGPDKHVWERGTPPGPGCTSGEAGRGFVVNELCEWGWRERHSELRSHGQSSHGYTHHIGSGILRLPTGGPTKRSFSCSGRGATRFWCFLDR